MMKRVFLAGILVMALVLGSFALPRRAAASTTDSLLISAYVAGGVAVIALIAILFANRDDDPEYFELVEQEAARRAAPRSGIRFATDCRTENGNLPVACW